MNTQPTLEQRILDALQPDVAITSADIAALIEEAEVGIAKAEQEARGLSNKVVDLFVRITNNCEALSALHQARPPGVMEHLLSAELHARGLDRGLY